MVVAPPQLAEDVRASLPTFFIIGAPKAGTTSLHEYLAEHPEIAMTTVKECMCFQPADWVERLGDYRRLFVRPARVRGESSTAYTAYPWAPEIPDRVHATVPDAKLIYIVRDPIPRTLSHYAQNVWDGFPVRPFDELMTDLEDPLNMPVWSSRYATQLERWLRRFATEQILVLEATELRDHRAKTLRQVFEFLAVDPGFTTQRWDREHNSASSHVVPNALGARLGAVGAVLTRTRILRRLVSNEVPVPVLRPPQRARLAALLAPEADRLRALTGLALEHWQV